jgi:hypothetical protein
MGTDGCRTPTHHLNTEKIFVNQEASFGSPQRSPIMAMSEENPQEFALTENHLPSFMKYTHSCILDFIRVL